MSQHPSLRVDSVGAKHSNVLKRFERIKKLQAQDKWKDQQSVYGLPKVKSLKIKVKKAAATPAAAEGAAPTPEKAAAPPPETKPKETKPKETKPKAPK